MRGESRENKEDDWERFIGGTVKPPGNWPF